jgi:hypothetical protein
VSPTAGLASENMTCAAARRRNVGTMPGGAAPVWCSCGSSHCVLIPSAITRGDRQRRSASTTSSPTREIWICSGTKATGSRSAGVAIQRRQRCRKAGGAELYDPEGSQNALVQLSNHKSRNRLSPLYAISAQSEKSQVENGNSSNNLRH